VIALIFAITCAAGYLFLGIVIPAIKDFKKHGFGGPFRWGDWRGVVGYCAFFLVLFVLSSVWHFFFLA